MDAPQMKAMTEATRLTREGRLAEATALIQQTLARPAAPWRTPDAPPAGEGNGNTPGHYPDPSQALPGGPGTKPRRAIPGWLTRRRALPSQDGETLVRPNRLATPAVSRRLAGLRPSPTPTRPAPATTGSTCPPATTALSCLCS